MSTVRKLHELTDAEIEGGLRSSAQLESAPEHVIQRAMALWQPRRQAAAAPGLFERVMAVLTFDSGSASPLAFGMRSAGGTTRQLLFSAQGHDVDLRISPAGEGAAAHWCVSGQVLGPEGEGIVVLSNERDEPVGEVSLSELGEFRLDGVAPGQYTVALRLAGREIMLPAVNVPQDH